MHLRSRRVCVRIASIPLSASCHHHHFSRTPLGQSVRGIAKTGKTFYCPRPRKQKQKGPGGERTGVTTTIGLPTVVKSPAQLTNNSMGTTTYKYIYIYIHKLISQSKGDKNWTRCNTYIFPLYLNYLMRACL